MFLPFFNMVEQFAEGAYEFASAMYTLYTYTPPS